MEAPMSVTGIGSLFALQFTTDQVYDYRSFMKNNQILINQMFIGLINSGFLLSNRCAGNISVCNTYNELDKFIESVKKILSKLGY